MGKTRKNIKYFALSLVLLVSLTYQTNAQVISGKINHDDINFQNKVVSSKTQAALSGAKITIPELHYTTYSDNNGMFELNADITSPTVLFVEKEGYKVFSLTVDNSVLKSPLKLGIEENNPFDIQLTSNISHLGDDMYSTNSANSAQFQKSANGHFLSKTFDRPKCSKNQDIVLKIGSLIGLDTKRAREMGQNKIAHVYSSPAEVIVNGNKIASLELNGDNIEIFIPKNALQDKNELVIQTGKNLFQYDYIDYDDIEIANLRIEVKDHTFFSGFKN